MIKRAAVLAVVLVASACQSDSEPKGQASGGSSPTASSAPTVSTAPAPTTTDDPALDAAVSTPEQDPVYPQVGNPVVDALHYQLDLTWAPTPSRLTGHETVIFRAAVDSSNIPLDLSRALEVTSVSVDGEDAGFLQRGQDLFVKQEVQTDERHTLVIDYHGTPEPVAAPTTRSDFSTNGWTIDDDGSTWTMQEPYGALTWYAVNDQPADKALYDFTLKVPSSMVGVANGQLTGDSQSGGYRTTEWHLSSPASSYLITTAFGDFSGPHATVDGVPISVWGPSSRVGLSRAVLRSAKQGMAFLTDKLGPFPFDSLGFLLVDSFSGMETQTMITLGAPSGYTTSPEVVVHEMAHQWYGDQVTPSSWRDVWMNEGMAMYLQLLWQADHGQGTVEAQLGHDISFLQKTLATDGPAADYDPTAFGEGNVYYVPAAMWEMLRQRLGDDEFWKLVREWPASHARSNAGYDDIVTWWSDRSGQELRPFFDTWLRSRALPADVPQPSDEARRHHKKQQVAPGSSPGQV